MIVKTIEEGNPNQLPEIDTARGVASINEAAAKGFWPLLKAWIPSQFINHVYSIYQHPKTGKIQPVFSMRTIPDEEFEETISRSPYYPYHFKEPFAAYLIPHDLKSETRVWVKEIIQDVAVSDGRGGFLRLVSCEGLWTGTDLEIEEGPFLNLGSTWIG